MKGRADLEADVTAAGDDALRTLCFSDAVFRQRYEGWRPLGRGAWATVVQTRSRDLGQDLALKVFVNCDPELLQRVREEVKAVQALSSPYLVHTYSLFDRGSIAWFEMELVDGPNLRQELDRLANGERLPLVVAYEIALAVSRCVWHAHRAGVLHRDVKPANVLLPRSGQPAAKVTDFGIARLSNSVSVTPPGAVTGTPRFASPEALAGLPVGPAHDIYGLGATLYTLLAGGRRPHDVPSETPLGELRRQVLTTPPVPLRALAREVGPEVEGLVMAALAPEPTMRPGAGTIVRTLERAQARLVASAGREGGQHHVSISQWRIAVAGLGLAALGLWARLRPRGGRRVEE